MPSTGATTSASRFRSSLFPTPSTISTSPSARERPRLAAQLYDKELGLDTERPVILFAGKLQTRKHCDHLLSAYAQLPHEPEADPHPYLVIVGDGEERAALERQAAATGFGSIRFCGFRNQSELPRYFDLASVFVLPSRHEPWVLIVNEVMNASARNRHRRCGQRTGSDRRRCERMHLSRWRY